MEFTLPLILAHLSYLIIDRCLKLSYEPSMETTQKIKFILLLPWNKPTFLPS